MSEETTKITLDKSDDVDFKVDLSKANEPKEEAEPEVQQEQNEQESDVQENIEAKEDTQVNEPLAEQGEDVKEESKEEVRTPSKEEIISEFLTNKYSMGLEQLDDVLSNKGKTQDLPEEVEKYLQYKNETKRGLKDFIKANEDVSEYEDNELLKEYYRQSNPEFDDSDIEYLIQDKFVVDSDVDTERDVKRKNLEKKQELHKAKQYFEQMRDKYRAPLESSVENLPDEAKEAVEFYRQYSEDTNKQEEMVNRQREVFREKTSKLFNDEFEGFEFKIGERALKFKPGNVSDVIENQSDLSNFINKHVDENGLLKDASKYHTALNMAMNPEAYAKFFYEQGKADAVNEVVADGKNIDMKIRSNVDSQKPGAKFRVINDGNRFSSGLRINKK